MTSMEPLANCDRSENVETQLVLPAVKHDKQDEVVQRMYALYARYHNAVTMAKVRFLLKEVIVRD